MDPFYMFPAENIEEICMKLDEKSLSRFMETSKRIHNICYDLYLKRQEEYKLRKYEPFLQIFEKLKNRTGVRELFKGTLALYAEVYNLCKEGKCDQEISNYMNSLINTITDEGLRKEIKYVFKYLFTKFPPR